MTTPDVRLGLFAPALHDRMVASAGADGHGALQRAYTQALANLVDALDLGAPVTFAAVRCAKRGDTIRFSQSLRDRLRPRLIALNLRIAEFACVAIELYLTTRKGF